jgi:hypothetical protein
LWAAVSEALVAAEPELLPWLDSAPQTNEVARAAGPYRHPRSGVVLAPEWTGGDPPEAEIRVVHRRGTDLNPLDVTRPTDRDRALAYIWADQADRLARTDAALAIAASDPPQIDREDAASWLERQLTSDAPSGTTRVVLHSIALQYFPPGAVARITAHLEELGRSATADAPLAWLRYERDPEAGGQPDLRLRLWPDGSDRVLALADPHGGKIEWRG